jgi:hypothetical protein
MTLEVDSDALTTYAAPVGLPSPCRTTRVAGWVRRCASTPCARCLGSARTA